MQCCCVQPMLVGWLDLVLVGEASTTSRTRKEEQRQARKKGVLLLLKIWTISTV